jgi:arsenate reductase-like glutaredoxin family protein
MVKEPRLLRRPLLQDGRRLLVGFSKDTYAEIGAPRKPRAAR